MSYHFSKIKVLLIGDLMIDHYLLCNSKRLSPEAPVPVLTPDKEYYRLGGAGNVALNMKSLNAQVTCVGYVGDDNEGKKLIHLLKKNSIDTRFVEINKKLKTTVKKRFFCEKKQIIRLDEEKKIDNWKSKYFNSIEFDDYDIVVLSDYNKGVLNNQWYKASDTKNIVIDPKKRNFELYKNANIITPNVNELQKAYGKKIVSREDSIKACKKMIRKYNFNYIIAKRGADGMIIVGKNEFVEIIEAEKISNPDVTGAGDTVISYLSLAYALTNDIVKSAKFANYAASKVVNKFGTSVLSKKEILEIRSRYKL
mgnify:FL=1|tara:strand:- start:671 stop:1600 length:930 start_codon:yes stop_codon:yes gene_type:complete